MSDKQVKIPKGKVLVSRSYDWLTYEVFFGTRDAGEECGEEYFKGGQLLDDGEKVEVREKVRNDGPGEPRDWTVIDVRIVNKGGRAIRKELKRQRTP
jgi:hypothetical protein